MKTRIAATLLGCGLALSACGTEPPNALAHDTTAADPTTPLPAPTGETEIVITGDLALPNVEDRGEVNLALFDQFGSVAISVDDPFERRTLNFQAVPADTFLGAFGIAPDAAITWSALDNYEVSLTRSQLANEGAYIAFRTGDGAPLPINEGGPARIVFPDPSGEIGSEPNLWIWSISRLAVD